MKVELFSAFYLICKMSVLHPLEHTVGNILKLPVSTTKDPFTKIQATLGFKLSTVYILSLSEHR